MGTDCCLDSFSPGFVWISHLNFSENDMLNGCMSQQKGSTVSRYPQTIKPESNMGCFNMGIPNSVSFFERGFLVPHFMQTHISTSRTHRKPGCRFAQWVLLSPVNHSDRVMKHLPGLIHRKPDCRETPSCVQSWDYD